MDMFFIDSSIIIEALKINGNEEASKIWEQILKSLYFSTVGFYVNAIVYSETVYKLLIRSKKRKSLVEDYIYILKNWGSFWYAPSIIKPLFLTQKFLL